MRKKITYFDDPSEFSLILGGPLFQLFLRTGLLKPPTNLVVRRIIVIVLIAWLPLFILAALSGNLIGGVEIPFLFDLTAQSRLLLCLPLFLVAEVIVHRRIKLTVRQFLERNIVAYENQQHFESIIVSSMRLRNSVIAELLLLVVAIAGGISLGKYYISMNVLTWYTIPSENVSEITRAGYWYLFVSLTIFRFFWLRWYFRIFIWYRFLWKVSRHIPLQLNSLHPDRSGGLAFLTDSLFAFAPILLAHTIALSGTFASKIWHEGASLPQFKLEIIIWMILLMILVFAPLFFFMTHLIEAKLSGLREYGILASKYVDEFRHKWFLGQIEKDEKLIGSPDIQSLADLSNSFQVVREMRLLPLQRTTLLWLAILTALPFLPLVLTMIPIEQLIDRAMAAFFKGV
jgi:hypothetical protein